MAQKTVQPKTGRSSRFSIALLAALIFAVVLMLDNMQSNLHHAQAEQEIYASRLAVLREENEKLRQAITHSDDPKLIEDIARNDLGMISPGEKIFRFQN